MDYEAWRARYQSGEQAARAAFCEWQRLAEELRGICGPTISEEEYKARATPRLAEIDRLAKKINFCTSSWKFTPDGERYQRLMNEQIEDEVAAGL